jgi:hypothetical protein
MEFYSTTKRNEIFLGKWMELETIILSEVSQAQKAKVTCSASFADYKSITNVAILLDTVTHSGETIHGRDRTREGNQKFNVVDVLTV